MKKVAEMLIKSINLMKKVAEMSLIFFILLIISAIFFIFTAKNFWSFIFAIAFVYVFFICKIHFLKNFSDRILQLEQKWTFLWLETTIPKMELCFRLDTAFIQEAHKRKLKSDWTRLQSK